MMPLPPERSSMMPTQQSKEMNRKAQVVVERERGEDNDGDTTTLVRWRRWRRRQ
jgi:hypothetical protein